MTTTNDWTTINKATWPEIQITPRTEGQFGPGAIQTRWNLTSKLDGHPFPFGIALITSDDNWEDVEPAYAAAGVNAMAEYAADHGDKA